MTRETIVREFAEYSIDTVADDCVTVSYHLIKNGKLWGTFHRIRKGANPTRWIDNGSYSIGVAGFSSREAAVEVMNQNEKRLAEKAAKN